MFQPQLLIGLFIGIQFIVVIQNVNARPVYNVDPSDENTLMYSQPNYSTDEILSKVYDQNNWNYTFINPEELGHYFEGDIIIPGKQNRRNIRELIINKKPKIWPNGIVPYQISPFYSSKQKDLIHIAISKFSEETCIRFRERTVETDYVYFTAEKDGCFSFIGRQGGMQAINLHVPFCFMKIGTIMHEMLHSLGFYHEHSRNDRDDYIKIVWDNIYPSMRYNFRKTSFNVTKRLDFEYDYGSIMQYTAYAFALDISRPSLVPLRHETTAATAMGQRIGFSPTDIDEIRAKYECKKVDAARDRDGPEELISFNFKSGNISLSLEYEDNIIDY